MQVDCEFRDIEWKISGKKIVCHTWSVNNVEQTQDNEIAVIRGRGKEDFMVSGLSITNRKLPKFPICAGDEFNHIRYVTVNNCALGEILNKNLKNFPALTYLNLSQNDLKFLSGDLFSGLKNLRQIIVSHNKLEAIEPHIIGSFTQEIELFDVAKNPCIDFACKFDIKNRNIQKDRLRKELNKAYFYVATENLREKWAKEAEAKDDQIADLEQRLLESDAAVKQAQVKIELEIARSAELQEHNRVLSETIHSLEPFISDMESFIGNDMLKDFTLILDNEEEIKIHKMIFAARNTVVADMIKNNPEAEELRLTDIPMDTLVEVVNFIYTDICPKNKAKFIEIYAVAEKLGIESLKVAIVHECDESMSEDNVFDIIALALKYKLDNLKEKAKKTIQKIFPDKRLQVDLAEQCEELRKYAEAKRTMDEIMRKFALSEGESSSESQKDVE